LVNRNVNLVGIGGEDFSLAVVGHHLLLGGAVQIPQGGGFGAKALNRVHDALLRGKKLLSDGGGPWSVVVQPLENGGIMGQGFNAVIPRLLRNLGRVLVDLEKQFGGMDLRGLGRGGENLGE
jgi:hypothetical protein